MVASSGKEGEFGHEDDYLLSNPYHLLGVFSSQVLRESPQEKFWKRNSPVYEMEKHCDIEITAQVSRVSSRKNGSCKSFTSNYWASGYNGCLYLSSAYYCWDSESLFNAFATAAFFKFVVFSIFEMRYLLAIWKANRPPDGENWEQIRRELSVLYSRFYGILLGGILIMYEFHKFLWFILLVLHSFWIPQIAINIVRDLRKPSLPRYILGITVTRIAIPLYIFGCPHNFMRIEPDPNWCICLAIFVGLQASFLLLQHYFGARCFIPRQILPEKYSYYRRFHQVSNDATDCVICMTSVELGQRSNNCMEFRSNDCMVTPCDHFFHTSCLQRWMDVKMECPTCRRSLPPA